MTATANVNGKEMEHKDGEWKEPETKPAFLEKGVVPAPKGAIIETASQAAAIAAKAEVEAAYAIAARFPRTTNDVRLKVLDACRRTKFAETAMYSKPVGGKQIKGLSIRAAEEMIRSMGNVRISVNTTYEDLDMRKSKVTVTDLENNTAYSQEISVNKTVERREPSKDRDVVATRTNVRGQPVFIIRATEDEMVQKEAAQMSKVIRNEGLRLIPSDILEEAIQMIQETLRSKAEEDPKAQLKTMIDCFHELGIEPAQLEEYLGNSIEQTTPADIVELRSIYTTIKDGQAKFSDYLERKKKGEAKPPTVGKKKGEGKKKETIDQELGLE